MNTKQANKISSHVDKVLRDNFIKNMVEGSDIAYQLIIDYITNGHNAEEVKAFCEKNMKNKKKIIKQSTK